MDETDDGPTLTLPNGDVIGPGDVVLFEGYPYRYVPEGGAEFRFVPIYWGDSDLDLTFASSAELAERWGEESRGALTREEWKSWLVRARANEAFGDEELDAIAEQVCPPRGLLDRLRRALR